MLSLVENKVLRYITKAYGMNINAKWSTTISATGDWVIRQQIGVSTKDQPDMTMVNTAKKNRVDDSLLFPTIKKSYSRRINPRTRVSIINENLKIFALTISL
jgi:hypothetical protein